MDIIIRTTGERTENKCITEAQKQGNVHIIRAFPFGESIRQTYKMALDIGQEFIPVVDADVILKPGVLKQAMQEMATKNKNIFCLDGKTNCKVMLQNRRAGIHIYRTSMIETAYKFIDDNHIKPESNVRRSMVKLGFPTYSSKIIFGLHDWEQYYKDLWRKTVLQTYKLAKMIGNRPQKWKRLSENDLDYKVIFHAHNYGKTLDRNTFRIDARKDYGAVDGLQKLEIEEKGEMAA